MASCERLRSQRLGGEGGGAVKKNACARLCNRWSFRRKSELFSFSKFFMYVLLLIVFSSSGLKVKRNEIVTVMY